MRLISLLSTFVLGAATLLVPVDALSQERLQIPEYREVNIEPGSDIQRELQDFLDMFRATWGAEDTDGLIALHVEDTEWINAYARMFTDTGSLAQFLEHRLFPAFAPGVSQTEADNMQLISMRALGDDAAVLHLYTDGNRGASTLEGRDLRRTHIHLVLARADDGWKIEHTAIMDARG